MLVEAGAKEKVNSAEAPFLKMLGAIKTTPKVHTELATPSAAALAVVEALRLPKKRAMCSLSTKMPPAAGD